MTGTKAIKTITDRIATKEQQKDELQEVYDRLEQAVSNIDSNEEWLRYLQFQSRFYSYSFYNCRDIGEVLAESAAYVVCQHLGIDTGDYSFGYIKTWAKEPDTIKAVGGIVQKIAKDIIEKFEA